ncbi:hypothetical protein [Streptomyces sp. NPDC058373]|uniref:hypothetical protein n=1 Tax=unclassified Streptomyces TaxID=2593676 RepID=UPI00364B57EC
MEIPVLVVAALGLIGVVAALLVVRIAVAGVRFLRWHTSLPVEQRRYNRRRFAELVRQDRREQELSTRRRHQGWWGRSSGGDSGPMSCGGGSGSGD